MIATPWIAAVAAIFLWWFSTGILLWRVRVADNGGPDQHLWSVLLSLPLLAAGGIGFSMTLGNETPQGVFLAFLSAMAIWGWIELAFLSGIITGPNKRPCPPQSTLNDRFLRGFGALAWHELTLLVALLGLATLSKGDDHSFALWTFAILFFARISAKLNLFFGVPRINTQFLPRPLRHLSSYFRQGPFTPMFPLSITLLSFAVGCMIERLWQAQTPGDITGFALLTALALLALLEHWFMVLPLPDEKLWRWMLPAPKPLPNTRLPTKANSISKDRMQEDPHGF